jgi:hypothetical protein
MNKMPTKIDINGFEVQLFDKMSDYVCNANFSNYADEEVDVLAYAENDPESILPKVLVRKINLYEDMNFLVGAVHDNELPEIVVIDSVEYTQVNFGEDEISYLKTEALEEPVYTLIYRTVKITNGVYLYVYPFDTEIFDSKEEAQAKADKLNCDEVM